MMRAAVLALVLVHVCGLELAVLARVGASWVPDFAVVLVVYALVSLSESRVLLWFVPIAIARAVLAPGSFVYWLWLLLAMWWLQRPFRRRFFPDRWPFQCCAGFVLAAFSSTVGSLVLAGGTGDPLGRGFLAWCTTALVTPGVLIVLRGLSRSRRVRPEIAG